MATKSKANDADKDSDEPELEPIGPNVDEDSESSDIATAQHTMDGVKDEDDEQEKDKKDDDETGHVENRADDEEEEEHPSEKKKSRKQRQREAKERDKRELAYLRIRVDQLEQTSGVQEARVLQGEAAALDARITQLQNQLALADEVVAEATTQGVKKDLLEGQRLQREINEKLSRLKVARSQLQEQVESATEAVDNAPRTPQVHPTIRAYAQTWMQENDWYDPKDDNNKETQRVKRIDAQILREGFDPREEEYWNELSRRVKKALPNRFDDSDDDQDDEDENDDEDEAPRQKSKANGKALKEVKRKSGGPTFTTRGREVPLKPNQVAISPARKAAMIEAGVWDDPAERQRYLKSFQKYDREHGNNRA